MLHHLHILMMLLLLLLLLLLLRVRLRVLMVVLLRCMLRRVGHAHRGRDRHALCDDRGRSLVNWHLAHRDALGRVELMVRRSGVRVVGLL